MASDSIVIPLDSDSDRRSGVDGTEYSWGHTGATEIKINTCHHQNYRMILGEGTTSYALTMFARFSINSWFSQISGHP